MGKTMNFHGSQNVTGGNAVMGEQNVENMHIAGSSDPWAEALDAVKDEAPDLVDEASALKALTEIEGDLSADDLENAGSLVDNLKSQAPNAMRIIAEVIGGGPAKAIAKLINMGADSLEKS